MLSLLWPPVGDPKDTLPSHCRPRLPDSGPLTVLPGGHCRPHRSLPNLTEGKDGRLQRVEPLSHPIHSTSTPGLRGVAVKEGTIPFRTAPIL